MNEYHYCPQELREYRYRSTHIGDYDTYIRHTSDRRVLVEVKMIAEKLTSMQQFILPLSIKGQHWAYSSPLCQGHLHGEQNKYPAPFPSVLVQAQAKRLLHAHVHRSLAESEARQPEECWCSLLKVTLYAVFVLPQEVSRKCGLQEPRGTCMQQHVGSLVDSKRCLCKISLCCRYLGIIECMEMMVTVINGSCSL